MGGGGNFQNFNKLGGANKLKWAEKIENSVIDPPYNQRGESTKTETNQAPMRELNQYT